MLEALRGMMVMIRKRLKLLVIESCMWVDLREVGQTVLWHPEHLLLALRLLQPHDITRCSTTTTVILALMSPHSCLSR